MDTIIPHIEVEVLSFGVTNHVVHPLQHVWLDEGLEIWHSFDHVWNYQHSVQIHV